MLGSGFLTLVLVVNAVLVAALALVVLGAVRRRADRSGTTVAGTSGGARVQPVQQGWQPAPPLSEATVAEVTGLLAQGKKIHAIKLLREATGVGLKEAKDRADRWSDPDELRAARAAGLPGRGAAPTGAVTADERLRIEAAAVVAASGWHVAEEFLREERGLSPEAARLLLDELG